MTDARAVVVVLGADDNDRPPHLEALNERMELRVTGRDGLADALAGARGLLLWDFFSAAVRDVWPHCGDLEWIHVAAAGVDTLLFPELVSSGVVVTNARGTFDRPIAEFVLASVLAHAKLLHESHDLQAHREWRHRETRGVAGATALVVGTGAIGREIARLLRAAGMDVRGAGRRPTADDPDFGMIVSSGDLAAGVPWADYVVNAVPLTPATTGLFDAACSGRCDRQRTSSTSVAEPAWWRTTCSTHCTPDRLDGASLDVFAERAAAGGSPLWSAPGLIVSAHMSGDVVGWRDTLARQFVDNAERWLAGKDLVNVVDKELGLRPRTPT